MLPGGKSQRGIETFKSLKQGITTSLGIGDTTSFFQQKDGRREFMAGLFHLYHLQQFEISRNRVPQAISPENIIHQSFHIFLHILSLLDYLMKKSSLFRSKNNSPRPSAIPARLPAKQSPSVPCPSPGKSVFQSRRHPFLVSVRG